MLVLAMSYDYGYDYGYEFAGLHFRMLLPFHCRYYVSFLFVELPLGSNEFLLFILLSIGGYIHISITHKHSHIVSPVEVNSFNRGR